MCRGYFPLLDVLHGKGWIALVGTQGLSPIWCHTTYFLPMQLLSMSTSKDIRFHSKPSKNRTFNEISVNNTKPIWLIHYGIIACRHIRRGRSESHWWRPGLYHSRMRLTIRTRRSGLLISCLDGEYCINHMSVHSNTMEVGHRHNISHQWILLWCIPILCHMVQMYKQMPTSLMGFTWAKMSVSHVIKTHEQCKFMNLWCLL